MSTSVNLIKKNTSTNISSGVFPNANPSIVITTNHNTISCVQKTIGTFTQTLTIPSGTYTPTSLVAQLNAALATFPFNPVNGPFNIQASYDNGKFSFSGPGPFGASGFYRLVFGNLLEQLGFYADVILTDSNLFIAGSTLGVRIANGSLDMNYGPIKNVSTLEVADSFTVGGVSVNPSGPSLTTDFTTNDATIAAASTLTYQLKNVTDGLTPSTSTIDLSTTKPAAVALTTALNSTVSSVQSQLNSVEAGLLAVAGVATVGAISSIANRSLPLAGGTLTGQLNLASVANPIVGDGSGLTNVTESKNNFGTNTPAGATVTVGGDTKPTIISGSTITLNNGGNMNVNGGQVNLNGAEFNDLVINSFNSYDTKLTSTEDQFTLNNGSGLVEVTGVANGAQTYTGGASAFSGQTGYIRAEVKAPNILYGYGLASWSSVASGASQITMNTTGVQRLEGWSGGPNVGDYLRGINTLVGEAEDTLMKISAVTASTITVQRSITKISAIPAATNVPFQLFTANAGNTQALTIRGDKQRLNFNTDCNFYGTRLAGPAIDRTFELENNFGTRCTSATTFGSTNTTTTLNGSSIVVGAAGNALDLRGTVTVNGGASATSSTPGLVKLTDTIGADASDTAASVTAVKSYVSASAPRGYDIIVLAGQSNMVGWQQLGGTTQAEPTNELTAENNAETAVIYQLKQDGTVGLAKETLSHVDIPNGTASIGLTFARLYQKYSTSNRKILLVPGAAGSTGFFNLSHGATTINGVAVDRTWVADGSRGYNLYEHMIKRTKIALAYHPINNPTPTYTNTPNANNRVVALLWHQGEDDNSDAWSGADGSIYKAKLTELVNNFRAAINNNTCPFVCGGLQPQCFPTPIQVEIAQSTIASSVYYSAFAPSRAVGVYTLNLNTSAYYDPGADIGGGRYVHFSAQGYRVMGARYWNAYMLAIENVPTVATITSATTDALSVYDVTNNRYTTNLSWVSVGATTTTIYQSVNGGAYTQISTGALSSPQVVNITPTNGATSTYVFKVEVSNSGTASPFPSATTASVSVSATPTPTGTITVSPNHNNVILTLSSYANLIGADQAIVYDNGVQVGATSIVSAFVSGYTLESLTPSTPYVANRFTVRFTNARTGLFVVVNVPQFTTTANPTIQFTTSPTLVASATPGGKLYPTYVGTSDAGLTDTSMQITWAVNVAADDYTVSIVPSSGTTTTWTNKSTSTTPTLTISGMTASTLYSITITPTKAGYTSGSGFTLSQYTAPTLALSGTPSISTAGVLSLAYTGASSITYTYANSTTPTSVIGSGTSSASPISSSLTGLTSGQSYIVTISATAGSGATRADHTVSTSAMLYSTATEYPPSAMTSDTTSGYIASASDFFGAGYEPYKAFNKSFATPTDRWNGTGSGTYTTTNITGWSASSASGSWLQLQLPSPITLQYYTFIQTDNSVAITGWLLLGSNDGTNWTKIDERSGQTFGTTSQISYNISGSPGSFNRYRLVVRSGVATMYEWRLFA